MKTILNDIPTREALINGDGALKIGYPGLTSGAIMTLESIVNNKMRVLELGSGGSTLFWAKNCRSVKSYETNADLYKDVKQKTKYLRGVDLVLTDRHGMSVGLASEPKQGYDIILINSDPIHSRRLYLANLALFKIKAGGWMVINNYQKFGMSGFNYSKKHVFTFDEVGFLGGGTRLLKFPA